MVNTSKAAQGIRIKHRLLDLGKRQAWLISEMKKREPNMFLDSSYMARLLDGTETSGPKMALINQILEEEEARQDGINCMGQGN